MITKAIDELQKQNNLTREEASNSFDEIMSGIATPAQIAAFLMGLAIKGETPEEIAEFAKIMREKCNSLEPSGEVLEIVGTGGDRVGTFNISTAAAIVCAAAGIPVAKHGNRSVSSKSGAADVLEALGVNIDLDKEENERVLSETDICFMFAPVYHQSMRFAAPVRKDLGIPTIFNILGPLANPANAAIQILGVYSEELLETMAKALKDLGIRKGLVVHGNDGLDEITVTGNTKAILIKDGELEKIEINPEDYNISLSPLEDLIGGDAEENAQIIHNIFNGELGAKRDAVVLNAGVALYIAEKVNSIEEGIKLAEEMIDSGKANKKLQEFVDNTNKI